MNRNSETRWAAAVHRDDNPEHRQTFVEDPDSSAVLSIACDCGEHWTFAQPYEED